MDTNSKNLRKEALKTLAGKKSKKYQDGGTSIAEGMKRLFGSKIEERKKEVEAEKAGYPRHILDMPEGSDKRRAMAVHDANKKNK